jgi:hypothetical protein
LLKAEENSNTENKAVIAAIENSILTRRIMLIFNMHKNKANFRSGVETRLDCIAGASIWARVARCAIALVEAKEKGKAMVLHLKQTFNSDEQQEMVLKIDKATPEET